MKHRKEYAVYKGDKFLFIGTRKERAERFNVEQKTVSFWATPSNVKRMGTDSKRLVAVILSDKEEL